MLLILLKSLVSQTSFLLFSPHPYYLILSHLRPGLLSLPEGIQKYQAGIASILLNFFFRLQPDFFWVWPNSFDAWGLEACANLHQGYVEKNETIERKVREEKNGTWARGLFKIKISILKAGCFCSTPDPLKTNLRLMRSLKYPFVPSFGFFRTCYDQDKTGNERVLIVSIVQQTLMEEKNTCLWKRSHVLEVIVRESARADFDAELCY